MLLKNKSSWHLSISSLFKFQDRGTAKPLTTWSLFFHVFVFGRVLRLSAAQQAAINVHHSNNLFVVVKGKRFISLPWKPLSDKALLVTGHWQWEIRWQMFSGPSVPSLWPAGCWSALSAPGSAVWSALLFDPPPRRTLLRGRPAAPVAASLAPSGWYWAH